MGGQACFSRGDLLLLILPRNSPPHAQGLIKQQASEANKNEGIPANSSMHKYVDQHLSKFKSYQFTTSWIITPGQLLAFRGVVTFYSFGILILSWSALELPSYYLFYLTHLSWISIILYFAIATCVCIMSRSQGHDHEAVTSSLSYPIRWILWNLYITQISFQFIVVSVFWALLSKEVLSEPTPLGIFININVHGLGLVFMLLDFYLNKVEMFYSQWVAPVLANLLFIGYAYVQHFALLPSTDFWVYGFLDYTKPFFWVYYVGIFFVTLLLFNGLVFLHKKRRKFYESREDADIEIAEKDDI